MINHRNTNIFFLLSLSLIAFLSLCISLLRLHIVPTGISSDTLLYFMNARAIAETGKDIYGHLYPLYFLHKDIVAMPLTIYVIAFFYKLFGSAHIIGYLPNILISTISIVVVGVFTSHITKNVRAGIFAAIALTFSPWHYHLSRTGFEGVFGFTLIFIGIYLSILGIQQKKYLFWSFVMMFLATLSYKAVNIFLLCYPFVLLCFTGISFAKPKRFIAYAISIWFIIFLQWFLLFFLYKDSYASGILSHTVDRAKKEVNTQMELSDAPRKLKLLLSNTPIAITTIAIQNYLHFFSPQYLFTTGDTDNRFSTTGHGQLYLLDGLFIVLGILWLVKRKNFSVLRLVNAIVIVAPLGSMIADEQYAIRTFVSVFIFATLSGTGASHFIDMFSHNRFKKVIFVVLSISYLFSVSVYLYRYHFLYVHYGRWAWNSNNKEVFASAYNDSFTHSQITFGGTSEFDYLDFMYWNHLPIKEVQHALITYDNKMLRHKNIRFTRTCTAIPNQIHEYELVFVRDECIPDIEPKTRYYLPKLQRYTWKVYDRRALMSE